MVADLEEQKIRRARSGSALVHDRLKIKGMIPGVFLIFGLSALHFFRCLQQRNKFILPSFSKYCSSMGT